MVIANLLVLEHLSACSQVNHPEILNVPFSVGFPPLPVSVTKGIFDILYDSQRRLLCLGSSPMEYSSFKYGH